MRVIDLAVWIMKNRKGDAFIGWSFSDILNAVNKSMLENTLIYSSENESITGVMIMHRVENKIHIYGAVVCVRGLLKKYASYIKQTYANCVFTADRQGKIVTYNVNKVLTFSK